MLRAKTFVHGKEKKVKKLLSNKINSDIVKKSILMHCNIYSSILSFGSQRMFN